MNLKNTKYNYLVEKYKDDVYHYSFYMLNNRFDAEDALQDVMLKTWQNLNKFSLLSAKAWIIKTTHNHCIDLIRKRKKHMEREGAEIEENSIAESLQQDENLENEIEIKSEYDNVIERIFSLPEMLKSVFILYEMEGMKYREIGKALDIPINSVKVYMMRARKKLQEELKSYGLQDEK